MWADKKDWKEYMRQLKEYEAAKTEGKPVLGTSMTTNNGNQESYAKT